MNTPEAFANFSPEFERKREPWDIISSRDQTLKGLVAWRTPSGFNGLCTKSGIHALLCAASVCSVPLWFIIAQKKQPQRHRAHRGCTEKKPNRDFSCKAIRTITG